MALVVALGIGPAAPVGSQHVVPTTEVTGRLVDLAGAPLPGLRVTFQSAATGAAFTARTDADGCYRLANLPTRQYIVIVHAADGRLILTGECPESGYDWNGKPPRWDRSIDPNLDCTITRPANLEGVVTDNEGPLPGVTVRLHNAARPCTQPLAITDVDGRFSLRGLTDGDYVLSAELYGFVFPAESIRLDAGEVLHRPLLGRLDDVERGFTFPDIGRRGQATGQVFDGNCRALGGVSVTSDTTNTVQSKSVTTAADGTFTPPLVVPGWEFITTTPHPVTERYRIRFELSGMQAGKIDMLHNAANFVPNWNVRLRPRRWFHRNGVDEPATVVVSTPAPAGSPGHTKNLKADLRGNVVDDHGCAVLGAVVTARDRATGQAWSVKSNGMGFRLVGLPTATYDLTVAKKGYLPVLVDAEPLGFSESLWSVTLLGE